MKIFLDPDLLYEECDLCDGKGVLGSAICPLCDGLGLVEHQCNQEEDDLEAP